MIPATPPLAGAASKAWSATFQYTTMQVSATVPEGAATVALPMTSLEVTFSNAYDPNSVDTTDLILSRGAVGSIIQVDADTVLYNLKGLGTAEGPLAVRMRTGAVSDSAGHPVLPFSTEFDLDYGGPADFSTPLTSLSPLQPVGPLGGLVYESSVSARISPNGDKDVFTIDLDPGQTISVVVDPAGSLKPVVTLVEPDGASTTTVSATNVGQSVAIQSLGPTSTGTYTITVRSVDGASSGDYVLQVILNAAVEQELHGVPSNDTTEYAEDIGASFISLTDASQRGAVVGDVGRGWGHHRPAFR